MSLYNMLMGRNPCGPFLMAALGFVKGAEQNAWLGRFRDVYTNDAGDRIFVLHRNYDGSGSEESLELIKQHPNYVAYVPDPLDYTYGTWEFTVPEEHAGMVKEIAGMGDNTPAMTRYRGLISQMQDGKDNEATRNAIAVGKKILGPILDSLEGPQNRTVVEHGDGSVVIGP